MKCNNPDCKYDKGDNALFPQIRMTESGVKEGKHFYKYSCAHCGTEWTETKEFKESPKAVIDDKVGDVQGSKHKKMLDYTFPTGDGWL